MSADGLCPNHWRLPLNILLRCVEVFACTSRVTWPGLQSVCWATCPRALPVCPCCLPEEALSTTTSLLATSSCPFIGKRRFFKTHVLSWRFTARRMKIRWALCSWWRAFHRTSGKQEDGVLVLFLAPPHPSLLYLFSPIGSSLECHCAPE